MLLLIDGYNLLQASDIFPVGRSAGTLAAAREAFLQFLAQTLEERLRSRTTIVFDAAMAPPGLPREASHAGITIRFAPRNTSADDVLESEIAAVADPRNLLVVSSDHRVQRAARQRVVGGALHAPRGIQPDRHGGDQVKRNESNEQHGRARKKTARLCGNGAPA